MNQTRSFLLIAWLFVAAWLLMQWNKAQARPPPRRRAAAAAARRRRVPLPPVPAAASGRRCPRRAERHRRRVGASPRRRRAADHPRPTTPAPDHRPGWRPRASTRSCCSTRSRKKPDSPNVRPARRATRPHLRRRRRPDRRRRAAAPARTAAAIPHRQRRQRIHARARRANGVACRLPATDPATGISVRRTLTPAPRQLRARAAGRDRATPAAKAQQRVSLRAPVAHRAAAAAQAQLRHQSGQLQLRRRRPGTPADKLRKDALLQDTPKEPPPTDGVSRRLDRHAAAPFRQPPGCRRRTRSSCCRPSMATRTACRCTRSAACAGADRSRRASATHASRLWVGPKLQAPMKAARAAAHARASTTACFTFISRPLFWLLSSCTS